MIQKIEQLLSRYRIYGKKLIVTKLDISVPSIEKDTCRFDVEFVPIPIYHFPNQKENNRLKTKIAKIRNKLQETYKTSNINLKIIVSVEEMLESYNYIKYKELPVGGTTSA